MRRASTSTTAAWVTPASTAWRMAWTSASVGRWRWASRTSISARVPAASPCLRRAAVQNASWVGVNAPCSLAQAREQGAFTPTHEAFWTAARRRHGDAAGTRALVEVLLAHRHLPTDALIQAMRQAVDAGVTQAAVVLVEARRIADCQPPAQVIPIGALQRFDRPTPALAGYDALLDEATAAGRGQPAEHLGGTEEPAHHRSHLEVVPADASKAEGMGA